MAEDRALMDTENGQHRSERRSGQDRRKGKSQEFFARGGIERRDGVEARKKEVRQARIVSEENAADPSPAGEE